MFPRCKAKCPSRGNVPDSSADLVIMMLPATSRWTADLFAEGPSIKDIVETFWRAMVEDYRFLQLGKRCYIGARFQDYIPQSGSVPIPFGLSAEIEDDGYGPISTTGSFLTPDYLGSFVPICPPLVKARENLPLLDNRNRTTTMYGRTLR